METDLPRLTKDQKRQMNLEETRVLRARRGWVGYLMSLLYYGGRDLVLMTRVFQTYLEGAGTVELPVGWMALSPTCLVGPLHMIEFERVEASPHYFQKWYRLWVRADQMSPWRLVKPEQK